MKEKFTPEEWEMLVEAPFIIGFAVSDADMDPDSAYKEFDAMVAACADGEAQYQTNELIQEVLAKSGSISNVDGTEESLYGSRPEAVSYFSKVTALLEEKHPGDESLEFRTFLYEIGERVAKAYGEGFLGLGNKISKKEAEMLGKLKSALKL